MSYYTQLAFLALMCLMVLCGGGGLRIVACILEGWVREARQQLGSWKLLLPPKNVWNGPFVPHAQRGICLAFGEMHLAT